MISLHLTKQKKKNKQPTQYPQRNLIIQLKKQNSFTYQFFLSIIKGLGNMIGASIIFGLLILWLKAHLPEIANTLEEYLRNKQMLIKP